MIKQIFDKWGVFLVEFFHLDQPEKGNPGLKKEVVILSAGNKTAVKSYYSNKVSAFLVILTVGSILTAAAFTSYCLEKRNTTVTSLTRPGYGEEERTEELNISINGQKEEPMEITVQARQYTVEQKKQLLRQAKKEIKMQILGDNPSFDEIRTDLVFPELLQDGAVTATWSTSPEGYLSIDGKVKIPETEENVAVEITAALVCDNIKLIYKTNGQICAPEQTPGEQLRQEIRNAVAQQDEASMQEEALVLPELVKGKQIVWETPLTNQAGLLLTLTLLAAAVVWIEMDADIHKKAKYRRNQLMMDYPDLIWKMTMLLSAGLSLKGTFLRIASEYQQKQLTTSNNKNNNQRYVYEEVVFTCYEMKSGISEAKAYERFGRRCELTEYIRLGSVLAQNLKKGSSGLVDLLAKEAETSLLDRKNHAKTIGEQAGTKLLIPMMLMLLVVMVVVMAPTTFGM